MHTQLNETLLLDDFVTFILKIAILDFVDTGVISVSQTHLVKACRGNILSQNASITKCLVVKVLLSSRYAQLLKVYSNF